MQTTTTNSSSPSFAEIEWLKKIPPVSPHPIRKIPQYVFENCNQATCNTYNSSQLAKIKERTKTLTLSQLKTFCQGDENKVIQKGEEFDWIYGLDTLEKEFLSGDKSADQLIEELLQSDTVMKMNALFSRFANEKPGEMRKKEIIWPKRDLNINEILAGTQINPAFTSKMGMHPSIYFTSNKKLQKECLIKKSYLTRKYAQIVSEGYQIETSTKNAKFLQDHWHEVNIEKAASEWSKEQNRNDDKIDLVMWLKSRYHFFPLAATLPEDLKTSLQKVRKAKEMHPIEKACRVWFDIVRIHISHEANKRTGKALLSVILLANGYLPPKIGKEEEKEFLRVFHQSLEQDHHLALMQFVSDKIEKTQKEYGSSIIT